MMNRRLPIFLSFAFALGCSVIACGSEDESLFGNENGNGKDGGANNNDPEGTFNDDPLGPTGQFAACASSAADTQLAPANLVVMFDKSGSMGDTTDGVKTESGLVPFDPNKRWDPVTKGMTDFFADKASSTLNASLQFFPLGSALVADPANPTTAERQANIDAVCGYPYDQPTVAMTSLTQSQLFVNAINMVKPKGGTPTLPALEGAIKYAKKVAEERPKNEKTVVVLVTDGYPGLQLSDGTTFGEGCPGNNITNISAKARDAAQGTPSIPTYVIGVDSALQNLNEIAVAGGTEKAFMISDSDPTATKAAFQKTLESIRAKNLSCDFAMPPPPSGQTIDPNAVNVVFARSDGKFEVLSYSKDCADGRGWHYNDPNNPNTVTLCQTTCTSVQSDIGGKLKLAFGCATKGELK